MCSKLDIYQLLLGASPQPRWKLVLACREVLVINTVELRFVPKHSITFILFKHGPSTCEFV